MAKTVKFEDAMERLEEIVRKLESGSSTLDESVALYEEAVKLTKICNEKLECAEQKVRLLVTDFDGSVTDKNFLSTDEN